MSSVDFNAIVNDHAAAQLAVAPKADTYRGWTITWDYGEFTATGPDYDASYEGPEDGWVDNGHRVSCRTREGLIEEVDAWFEEHAPKPTPGPWNEHYAYVGETVRECKPAGASVGWFFRDFVVASGEKIIARVSYNSVDSGFPMVTDLAEAEANFRMILAAPELLEACEAMIRWDDAEKSARPFDEDNGNSFYARMNMCAEAFDKARAAIAKATIPPAASVAVDRDAPSPAGVIEADAGSNRGRGD